MRAFLLGASLAAVLAGCSAQQADVRIKAVGAREVRADSGSFAKGQALLVRGEYALAVDAYRKAIRYAPDNAAAYNGLAVAYDQLGRHDLSRRNFELALAHAPGEAKYYRNFVRSLERQGLEHEARKLLADMRAVQGGLATAAPTPHVSLRSLAALTSEAADSLTDAASARIRPFLERVSLGEVILSTGESERPVMAGRSITVPIPPASTQAVREVVARPLGRSITVEIPPAIPLPVEEARAEPAQVADIPLATLDSGSAPLQPAGSAGILLAAAAAEPAELLALALRPQGGTLTPCTAPGRPEWVREHDLALKGDGMRVFTGDFAPMRLGATGGSIDLPLFYPASANLPISAGGTENGTSAAGCSVRMADAPPVVDVLFSSLWLAWRDLEGTG